MADKGRLAKKSSSNPPCVESAIAITLLVLYVDEGAMMREFANVLDFLVAGGLCARGLCSVVHSRDPSRM